MLSERITGKIFLISILGIGLIVSASAASIDVEGDGTVWLNSEESFDEVEVSCSEGEVEGLYVEDKEVSYEEGVVETSDFQEADIGLGEKTVELQCSGEESAIEEEVSLFFDEMSFDLEKEREGIGFVGQLMRDESGSLGNRQHIDLSYDLGAEVTDPVDDLDAWGFTMDNGLSLEQGSAEVENGFFYLYPDVTEFSEESELRIFSEETGFSITYELSVSDNYFFIHDWRAEKVGDSNPGRDINYEDVEAGEYELYLDMQYRDRSTLPETDLLESDNFELTVLERDDGDYEESPSDEYSEMNIMGQEDPGSGSEANYRVYIDEYSQLDELDSGRYKFQLEVVYDPEGAENEPRRFLVDETRVDKSSEFSGVVLNSGGSGVVTEMVLRSDNTRQTVVTDETGRFSTEIEDNMFDIDASFYRTSGDTDTVPDTEVTLTDVDLEEADLGPGSSAIRYDYWEDPEVDIDGLKPVNMMVAKFGYPVGDIEEMRMSFDSGELDPQDMKIFECEAWNFEGQECMTEWGEAIDDEDITVNPATWTVKVDNTELYEIEGQEILMNAYVIGTNSEITLQDSIDVRSTQIRHGDDLEASGVLIDDTGDRVEDANVTLSLMDADHEWEATTDSTGSFDFSEPLEADSGNYQLKLEAERDPYRSFEMESDSTISVYYETGLNVFVSDDSEIAIGEESALEFELENTGQSEITDIEFDVSGVDSTEYELTPADVSSIDAESSTSVVMALELTEDFCPQPCNRPPAIELEASGTSSGETVQNLASVYPEVPPDYQSQDSESEETGDQDSDSEEETAGITGMGQATAEFVESRSDMNLVLSLILMFGAIMALAVRKKDDGSSRGGRGAASGRPAGRASRGGGGRSRQVQKPDVSPKEEDDNPDSEPKSGKSQSSEESAEQAEEDKETEDESSDSEEGPVCDVCGETFDTESGVKLHKQALHDVEVSDKSAS